MCYCLRRWFHMVTEVNCWNWFADHSGIGACLEIPIVKLQQRVWGRFQQRCHGMQYDVRNGDRPSIICQMRWPLVLIIEYYNGLGPMRIALMGSWDTSIGHLPTSCRGRCQQKEPVVRDADCPLLKPSRPGEVHIKTDFVRESRT